MDPTPSNEEEILAKHRKERKELQAEIQKLKKSVSKGDKKKKKEVNEEIANLEAKLTCSQEKELADFKALHKGNQEDSEIDPNSDFNSLYVDTVNKVNQNDEENVDEELTTVRKKSKAQKRRDKKACKEKEREERIKEQEVENLKGPRHLELVEVTKILTERGLTLHQIPADGNCLYNAIGHQLSQRNVEMSCSELREKTADYMRSHPDDFIPFLIHPDTGDIMTIEQFSAYCDKTAKSPVWGGQIELRAMSEVLGVPIQVLQAGVQPLLIGDDKQGAPMTVIYQRHAYRLGEHYNSAVLKAQNADEEDT